MALSTWRRAKTLSHGCLRDMGAVNWTLPCGSFQIDCCILRHSIPMFVRTIHIVNSNPQNDFPGRCILSFRHKTRQMRSSALRLCNPKYTIQKLVGSLLSQGNVRLCFHYSRSAVILGWVLIHTTTRRKSSTIQLHSDRWSRRCPH